MSIKHALIVDDSKSARLMLQRMLKNAKLSVDSVDSGEAALDYLKGQHPDIIFMDHMMPGMNGLETTRSIKSNPKTKDIPTVMYTSKEGNDYVQEALSTGAINILPKPATPNALESIIKQVDAMPASITPKKISAASVQTAPEMSTKEIQALVKKHMNKALISARKELDASVDTIAKQLADDNLQRIYDTADQFNHELDARLTEFESQLSTDALHAKLKGRLQNMITMIASKLAASKSEEAVKALSEYHNKKMQLLRNEMQSLIIENHEKQVKLVTISIIASSSVTLCLAGLLAYFL
jgi:CheY-like chemotaxis protein